MQQVSGVGLPMTKLHPPISKIAVTPSVYTRVKEHRMLYSGWKNTCNTCNVAGGGKNPGMEACKYCRSLASSNWWRGSTGTTTLLVVVTIVTIGCCYELKVQDSATQNGNDLDMKTQPHFLVWNYIEEKRH